MTPNRFRFRAWNNVLKQMDTDPVGHAISFGGVHCSGYVDGDMCVDEPSDPSDYIIMQSTGLSDGKGVEIFEGDIVALHGEPRKVVWSDAAWYYVDEEGDGDMLFFHHRYCEVIGNIHENKELVGR